VSGCTLGMNYGTYLDIGLDIDLDLSGTSISQGKYLSLTISSDISRTRETQLTPAV